MGWPSAAESAPLPVFLQAGLRTAVQSTPAQLQSLREDALTFWQQRKAVTGPLWREAFGKLPAHCQSVLGPGRNLLLLSEMLEHIQWPDKALVRHLMHGFPLVGVLPSTGVLAQVAFETPQEDRRALLQSAEERNAEILRRASARPAMCAETYQLFLDACHREVRDGKARFRALSRAACVLTPRFPAVQGWKDTPNGRVPRVRCIDDFTASKVNGATVRPEKSVPETLDTLVALIRFQSQGNKAPTRWRKDDFVQAFKSLPICTMDLPLAVTVWPEAIQQGKCLQLFALPFGSSASVAGWDRFGLAVQAILARIFALVYLRFVDDLFAGDQLVELPSTSRPTWVGPAGSANLARAVLSGLLGAKLDDAKAVTAEPSARILGVEVSFCDDAQEIEFQIGPDKLELWSGQIRTALTHGVLQPAEAQKLAHRLSWGACAVFGKGARVPLAAIFHHGNGSRHALSSRVRLSLQWWLRFLETKPRRVIPVRQPARQKCILYSDAAGSGRMAWVCHSSDFKSFATASVPNRALQWVHFRKNQIGTWELLAAVCALQWIVARAGQDVEVVCFVDNRTALGSILRGCSRQSDWNDLIGDLWLQAARHAILMHAWYVPSHLNLADGPTRPEQKPQAIPDLVARGYEQVAWQFPADAPWER